MSITHNERDSNRGRRSFTLLFLRQVERGAARGVDRVDARREEQERLHFLQQLAGQFRGRGSMEEIKKEWSCCRAQQDQPKGRDRRCDDEHDNIPRQDSERRGDRPCDDEHDLSHGRTAQAKR